MHGQNGMYSVTDSLMGGFPLGVAQASVAVSQAMSVLQSMPQAAQAMALAHTNAACGNAMLPERVR